MTETPRTTWPNAGATTVRKASRAGSVVATGCAPSDLEEKLVFTYGERTGMVVTGQPHRIDIGRRPTVVKVNKEFY